MKVFRLAGLGLADGKVMIGPRALVALLACAMIAVRDMCVPFPPFSTRPFWQLDPHTYVT